MGISHRSRYAGWARQAEQVNGPDAQRGFWGRSSALHLRYRRGRGAEDDAGSMPGRG